MKLLWALLILMTPFAGRGAETADGPRVLLADIPLTSLGERGEFANALHALQSGDVAATRRELLALTTSGETYARLLAWNALRDLGVQPTLEEASIVRGVVIEHADDEPLGVYEDGRWRLLGAAGGEMAFDPADREQARLIRSMLAAAEQTRKTTRPMPHADTTPLGNDRVRLTVLTYAGFHVVDASNSMLTEEDPSSIALRASKEIRRSLDSIDRQQ